MSIDWKRRSGKVLPLIKLIDFLEVATSTGFNEQFIYALTNHSPEAEEKAIALSGIIAMA
ncbi:hypothetical protein [Virgibacillus dakarensis]|uniref:hypothetical protein n=1 Tax=Virgibacillus dakarensis TaxID=1917889 RepID=UPI000B4324E7|nr:hypothetical protein [Virgibacillus dakarensis]